MDRWVYISVGTSRHPGHMSGTIEYECTTRDDKEHIPCEAILHTMPLMICARIFGFSSLGTVTKLPG
ncbi:hypothetical protein N7456_012388 [Penicillium angulare]|uniref:Uncharacterized protein n=1 Tax=Penicillium angulare TaxID=116970 RepID=A0A9W9K1M2_9EURO|nr:hypothetical protein N7456_012388 [Penicillium angulare]